jgi:SAM-dependent methyltransferase
MSGMRPGLVEITDLLWPVDAGGLRLPVRRDEVAGRLDAAGQRRAARIVSAMPATGDVVDAEYVDALGMRVHCELQRLGEELQLGRRVAALLTPVLARTGAVRVVDVGCGLGFVVRWLAATGRLGDGVELVGMDLNPVLVAEATRLAGAEHLRCRFEHGDALAADQVAGDGARTIVISTGLLHHLPGPDLPHFFAAQARLGVAAFAHWDIVPCLWSTLGAWVFHQARMREPVSRHDGVVSARRSHPARVLLDAARSGAPGYQVTVAETRWQPCALDVLRPVLGIRA